MMVSRPILWLHFDVHLARIVRMTMRLKYLLIAVCISVMMWVGIINGVAWYASDGTDDSYTASPH